jgi:hypothetical protein
MRFFESLLIFFINWLRPQKPEEHPEGEAKVFAGTVDAG